MRGRRQPVPITSDRLQRLCLEVGRRSDEGQQVLDYLVEQLTAAPPEGISLPSEWIDPLMVASGNLACLADQLADTPPGWLATTKAIGDWIRTGQSS
jgi:hypothetical protein